MPTFILSRRNWLICLALAVITIAVYWPVWFAQFLNVDDQVYVTDNPIVQQGLTPTGVAWAFGGFHVANYHPLTWLSHMLDCQLFGVDPRWHHAVNLLLHCANVVLVFLLLRQMTGRVRCSAVVAAVFAIHPLHVESVAWVSERKDLLSALFFLLMLMAWTSYVRRGGSRRYLTSLALFALGLLSKPMLVTVPCILLLLDIWPLGRTRWAVAESVATDQDPPTRSLCFLLVEKTPFFALSAASAVATMLAQFAGGAVASMQQMSLAARLGNAIVSYVRYARNFLWPATLSAYYPMLRPWSLACVFGCAFILITITATFLWLSRRRPWLAVGWLWFLGMLVPVIGLMQVGSQAMADRYMYLPLLGLTIMLAWAAAELAPHIGRRRGIALAVVALMSMASITAQDVRWWHDGEALFSRSLELTEPNVFALQNIGNALLKRGQTEQAIARFEQGAALQPNNPHVRRALGFALKDARRFDRAVKELTRAIRIDPSDGRTWNAMGHVYADQNKWPAAADHFEAAVELNPEDLDSRVNLAIAHRQSSQPQLALRDLEGAIKLNPSAAQPWYMYGALLLECGKPAAAVDPLRRAVAIDSALADGHYRLGLALMRSGHGDQAVAPLLTAIKKSPNAPEPLAKLAWLLATHPDAKLRRGEDAIFLAERANALAKSSPQLLSVLAAARAEQHQFKEAARTATDAAELAEVAGDTALWTTLQRAAAQYRAGEPTRDATLVGVDTGDALP